jgi:hypothetical protein
MVDDDGARGGGDNTEEQQEKTTPLINIEPSVDDLNLPKDPGLLKPTDSSTTNKTGTLPKTKKSSSRSNSPQTRSQGAVRQLTPLEVERKTEDQLNRLSELQEIQQLVQDSSQWSVGLIEEVRAQVDDLTRLIAADHEVLTLMWSLEVDECPYFKNKVSSQAIKLGYKLRRDLARLKDKFAPPLQPTAQVCSAAQVDSKLPDISLPHFSGTYSEWPNFRDMFESMILREGRLPRVQKLHYLRNCLSGEPAQIVSSFELRDSSFDPAWKALSSRYENKRLVIQSHLDRLLNMAPITQRTSEALNRVATVSTDAKRNLEALEVGERLGDMLLVHLTVRTFDRITREAWESSLGTSQDFPTFAQVEQFLQTKARALERVEESSSSKPHHAQHSATSKGSGSKRGAHTASKTAQNSSQPAQSASDSAPSSQKTQPCSTSAQPSKTTSFAQGPTAHACDYCKADHFVVACPHFRKLPVHMRMDFVESRKLCYNCLGRHGVRSCKSSHRCKTCNAQHHTMLHGYKPGDTSDPKMLSSSDSTD